MGHLIYSVTIYPLEFLMKLLLEFIYNLSGNYTLSIIALSAAVSVGVLPLYHIAEKWQDAERAIQQKMKPRIDELKAVFSGQELHSYLRVLYRQNGYSPLYAFRSMAGLLIQIPFFIAAYHLLSNHEGLKGVAVLFIKDLAFQDKLLRFGSLKVNFLPFLMTFVNIVSSMIYSKKLRNPREKVQVYGIALLFLALLYTSPAGLLLYWTFNNFFSLIKNAVYRIIDKEQYTVIDETPVLLLTDNRLLRKIHDSLKLHEKRIFPDWLLFSGMMFISLLMLVNLQMPAEKARTDIGEAVFLFTLALFALYMLVPLFLSFAKRSSGVFLVPVHIVLWSASSFFLWKYYTTASKNGSEKTFSVKGFVLLLIVFLVSKLVLFIKENLKIHLNETQSKRLFAATATAISVLAFLTAPSSLLESGSHKDFGNTFVFYMKFSFVALFISLFLFALLYRQFKTKRKLLTVILLYCLLAQLGNIFLFSGNYGDMSNMVIQNGYSISPVSVILNIIYHLFVLVLVLLLVKKKSVSRLLPIPLIVIIGALALSVHNKTVFDSKAEYAQKNEPKQLNKLIRLSKTGKNVVVLMLDRFVGGYVYEALDMVPALKSDYDGFTWYPNTVSVSQTTYSALPAVMGGYEYTAFNMNEQRVDDPLSEKILESARILPVNFINAGYSVTIISPGWASLRIKPSDGLGGAKVEDPTSICSKIWLKKEAARLSLRDDIPKKFIAFGLFRSVSPLLRETFYDKGNWFIRPWRITPTNHDKVTFYPKGNEMVVASKNYSALDLMPDMTEVDSSDKSSFVMMFNNTTHEPWAYSDEFRLDLSGKIEYDKAVMTRFGNDLQSVKHVYCDTTALVTVARWLKHLKDNGVYDNTRIVIISDHGRFLNVPSLYTNAEASVSEQLRASVNSLFMVKDFASRGDLKTDGTFMVSADTPAVAMNGLTKMINPFTGKIIAEPESKVPLDILYTPWRPEENGEFKYTLNHHVRIEKPDITDDSAWIKFK